MKFVGIPIKTFPALALGPGHFPVFIVYYIVYSWKILTPGAYTKVVVTFSLIVN
jgi:hypothetical protein